MARFVKIAAWPVSQRFPVTLVRAAAGAAQARSAPVPVVGYESGAELEAARQGRLFSIGELAVWVSP